MKKILRAFVPLCSIICFLLCLSLLSSIANNNDQPNGIQQLQRSFAPQNAQLLDVDLAPFYHGVASGDPLHNRVIIWTRVTPEDDIGAVNVKWWMATDVDLQNVVQSGEVTTGVSKDFTVKVDVTGLESSKTYYYVFEALGKKSLIGKTKTTPVGTSSEHLKFAVVSCNMYQSGYFTAYRKISERNDLDAVIHLGDYIYEYGNGGVWALSGERPHEPANEVITLADYRTRFSLYHLDTDLRAAHQQHPFITVWDDHEVANNANKEGAENHTSATEGDWNARKTAARKAYYEWMPIREAEKLYRTISYGDLMDLVMIDTRFEGREAQIYDINNPDLYAEDRTMLGQEQLQWFQNQLNNSTAKWKVVGNQVIFSQMNLSWLEAVGTGFDVDSIQSLVLDVWDGYPAERDGIIQFLEDENIDNTVILTGDFHTSLAVDVSKKPVGEGATYNPDTGEGSLAIEFATPSITSPNFDEFFGEVVAGALESCLNTSLCVPNPNPHLKFLDVDRHGYFILDVQPEEVQADYYLMESILVPDANENFEGGWFSIDGENHISPRTTPSPPKTIQDIPAPPDPPMITDIEGNDAFNRDLVILSLYPNPSSDFCLVNYVLSSPQTLQIQLLDLQGKVVREVLKEKQGVGNYALSLELKDLEVGVYYLKIKGGGNMISREILKVE
ncbi:MAG: alkaline phosphatase D family protein [Chitinophagales bacterium]